MTRALRWLEEADARWADRPRVPPADWLPPPPPWFSSVPRLAPAREGADRLWTVGELVWGRFLMANNTLWEPGDGPAGAEILWSDDPWFRRFPDAFDGAKEAYWTLKTKDTLAAGHRALRAFAVEEQRPYTRGPFPPLLAGNRVVMHATTIVYREHLPTGRLVHDLVPLVRARSGDPRMVNVAPKVFWPAELVQLWERDAE